MSDNKVNFDANIEDFPKENLEAWEFHQRPSNDKGDSDTFTARVDPALGRIVDELIIDCKGQGLPLSARADFVRLAIFRTAQDIQKYINNSDEGITNYLLLEKQIMQEAHKSAMLEKVLQNVQNLTKGLAVLSADYRQDWDEVNKRITDFLKPVMSIQETEPFLAKLYVTELFQYTKFKDILASLRQHKRISKVIRDAEKFYKSNK